MEQPPNMTDYKKEHTEFSLSIPEMFSFPLDVFDKCIPHLAATHKFVAHPKMYIGVALKED